jgi:hypothetical protein
MIDLFLVTATEAETNAALLAAGVIDDESNPVMGISVDQIGPFVRNGIEYVDWHTNLRGTFTDEQLAALDPLRIYPTLPYRVFAG